MRNPKILRIYIRVLGINIFIIVFMVSLIASLVSTSMYSIIHSLDHVLSEAVIPSIHSRHDIIVLTSSSTTPFTSVFKTSFINRVDQLDNIVISRELVVPVIVLGKPVILRGIDRGFLEITNITVLKGTDIDPDCLYCLWVGCKVVDYIGVDVGDEVSLSSFFSRYNMTLRIVGVYETKSIYDHEVMSSIYVAQMLRGNGIDIASIIKIKYDQTNISREEVLRHIGLYDLGERAEKSNVPIFVLEKIISVGVHSEVEAIPITREHVSEIYLRRLGLSSDILYIGSILIILIVGFSMYCLGVLVFTIRSREIYRLHEQGMPINVQKKLIILLSIPVILISTLTGMLLSMIFVKSISLRLLFGYTVVPLLNIGVETLVILSNTILYSLGILSRGVFVE